jgi:hypothetical protein
MKPKRVTVTLTTTEAECLIAVAGKILGDSRNDLSRRDWSAAARGHDKIQLALHPTPNLRPENRVNERA